MDQRLLCIRHGNGPTDDRVTIWCQTIGIVADQRRPWQGDAAGEIGEDVRGVVVFGGNYNAYETKKHPFLAKEYRLIDAAMRAGIPLLGICQGAQMIAHHMGAFAGAPAHGQHEFGYYEIRPTAAGTGLLPKPLHMCQWHFHTFDIPVDATHLARSDAFENQAFSAGKHVLALQFHAEQTIESFRRWQAKAMARDTYEHPGVQPPTKQTRLMLQHDKAQADWFYGLLDQFFGGFA